MYLCFLLNMYPSYLPNLMWYVPMFPSTYVPIFSTLLLFIPHQFVNVLFIVQIIFESIIHVTNTSPLRKPMQCFNSLSSFKFWASFDFVFFEWVSFFFIFIFSIHSWTVNVQYKFCRWLDLSRGPLQLEAITLPFEPQRLPFSVSTSLTSKS